MTNLVIKKCCVRSFNNSEFPMVIATIVDEDHRCQFEVSEWLKDETHVVRKNSCIKENDQVDFTLVTLTEILNLLDVALLQIKNHEGKIKHFLNSIKLFGKVKLWL